MATISSLQFSMMELNKLVTSYSISRFIVSRLHVHVRLMGNFGLYGSKHTWLQDTDCAICFICNEDIESVTYFFLDCSYFRNNFEYLWNKLKFEITGSNPTDAAYICNFIANLDGHNLLFEGGWGACSSLR